MNSQNNFIMNISVIYRYVQKYFDRYLAPYGIGSGQMIFLLLIYENEGITMQQLTRMADFDKGTTTKGIQRLIEQEYISVITDEKDRRVKRLYTTKKTGEIINVLYNFRNECCNQLMKGLDSENVEEQFAGVKENVRAISPQQKYSEVRIGRLDKLSLSDYPGLVAGTIHTSGCNFKCPYCFRRDLVYIPENFSYVDPVDVLDFLNKRKGILDGVCFTGGEPLLQPEITDFIREVKNMGYKVKIDTNGFRPDVLKDLVSEKLVDYVAMDVKNVPDKYAMTVGLPDGSLKMDRIMESIEFLLRDPVDYEFRTTVVRQLHDRKDIEMMAEWLKNSRHYYLQKFVDGPQCVRRGYSAYDDREMQKLLEIVRKYIPHAQLRGVQ